MHKPGFLSLLPGHVVQWRVWRKLAAARDQDRADAYKKLYEPGRDWVRQASLLSVLQWVELVAEGQSYARVREATNVLYFTLYCDAHEGPRRHPVNPSQRKRWLQLGGRLRFDAAVYARYPYYDPPAMSTDVVPAVREKAYRRFDLTP